MSVPRVKYVTVSSKDLENGISYRLPRPIQTKGIRVVSAMIPNTWYNITEDNNVLYIRANYNYNYYEGGAVVPPAYYTPQSLCDKLTELLNNHNAEYNWRGTWSVTWNPATGRVTIANSAMKFRIWRNKPNSIHQNLGFGKEPWSDDTASVAGDGGSSQTGDYAIALARIETIHLKSNLGTMLADYTHSSFPNVGSLVASFHVQGGWGQSFVYQNSLSEFFNFDSKGITEEVTEIEIELCDDKLRPIDFNGHTWTIQFAFLT